jgi:hypothetical protein
MALMEAASTSETSVYFNDTTRRNIPDGCHLHDLLVFTTMIEQNFGVYTLYATHISFTFII